MNKIWVVDRPGRGTVHGRDRVPQVRWWRDGRGVKTEVDGSADCVQMVFVPVEGIDRGNMLTLLVA